MKDEFGTRMKSYEFVETSRQLNPFSPIYARIDGKNFHSYCKKMIKPFDAEVTRCMIETTKYLVKETNALVGYTQSDEINLVWLVEDPESDVWFSGKILKMTSVLASMATAKFNSIIWPEVAQGKLACFDARVLQLPSKTEATNMMLWRHCDATRNAIQMIAQTSYSAKQLHKKKTEELLTMIKGYETYPLKNRLGTFVSWLKRERNGVLRKELLCTHPSFAAYSAREREEFIFADWRAK